MAYNVAANLRQTRPGAAFLEARDNVARNALAERQVAGSEQAQQFNQQNALFNQQRLAAADKTAAQELSKEQEKQVLQQSYTQAQRILAAPPGQRRAVADALFDDEDRAELAAQGIDYNTLDDDGIAQVASKLENQIGAALGVGPAAQPVPFEQTADAAKLRMQQQNALELERLRQRGDNSGGNVSWQIVTRPVGGGMVQDFDYNPKTRQRVPNGEPYKPVTTMTGNVTEGERKAAALATRLDASLQKLQSVTADAPNSQKPGVIERGLENMGMETVANSVRSPARQRVNAAQLDALDAALTLATGAAYTREQLESLRTSYFPQLGDDETTVQDKRDRFALIVETARIAAGRAEPSVDKALATRPAGDQSAVPNGVAIRNTSKSGKPIVSRDGGKTWEYE